jgi:hypothetical protein
MWCSLILMFGVVLSMFSIEKIGRRPGLIFGGLGLTACLLIVGGMGTIANQTAVTGGIIVAFSSVVSLTLLSTQLMTIPVAYGYSPMP